MGQTGSRTSRSSNRQTIRQMSAIDSGARRFVTTSEFLRCGTGAGRREPPHSRPSPRGSPIRSRASIVAPAEA